MSQIQNLPGYQDKVGSSSELVQDEDNVLEVATSVAPGNWVFTGTIDPGLANFSIKIMKDATTVARIDVVPSESQFFIVSVKDDIDNIISPSLTKTFANPMAFWYVACANNTISIVITDGIAASVMNVAICSEFSNVNSIDIPPSVIGTIFDSQAQFEAAFLGAKSSYGALQVIYNFFNPPITNPPPPLNICSETIPPVINTQDISTNAWIAIGILIGSTVIFLILFILAITKVIQ